MDLLKFINRPIEGWHKAENMKRVFRSDIYMHGANFAFEELARRQRETLQNTISFGLVTGFLVSVVPLNPVIFAPVTAFAGLTARDQFRYYRNLRQMVKIAKAGGDPSAGLQQGKNGFTPPAPMPPMRGPA